MSCTQPIESVKTTEKATEQASTETTGNEPTDETPAQPPTVEEPTAEEPAKERIIPMLKPIKIYPAYMTNGATVFGIPSDLQGIMQREKVDFELEGYDNIPGTIDFFTIDGTIYITHVYTEYEEGGEPVNYIDYYKQFGEDKIELVSAIPNKPTEKRVTLDNSEWLIETVVLSGVELTQVYNRHEVFGERSKNPKGHGPFTESMVTGYSVLDNGLIIMANSGAKFMPSNRLSWNEVGEYGRLWK